MTARAHLIGERIDTKPLEARQAVATAPTTLLLDERVACVVFRFGAIVLFGATDDNERTFLDSLCPLVHGAYGRHDTEEAIIQIDPGIQIERALPMTILLGRRKV